MHRKPLLRRTVDKGTRYERTVVTDPNTMHGAQEVYDSEIMHFLSNRTTMRRGKTATKRKGGAIARRMARRGSHNAWMAEVNRNPNSVHPHPFYKVGA